MIEQLCGIVAFVVVAVDARKVILNRQILYNISGPFQAQKRIRFYI